MQGRCRSFVAAGAPDEGGEVFLTIEGLRRHPFVATYADMPSDALLRWVQVGGSNGGGHKLARSLYETDPEIDLEIEVLSETKQCCPFRPPLSGMVQLSLYSH